MNFTNLKDIKEAIENSGLTKCEDRNCDGCEFAKKSPEYEEFGSMNICGLLNEVYKTK